MITSVYPTSTWVTTSNPTGPYISPGAASAGMLRYHNNQTQVYDGNIWQTMGGGSSVGLTSVADAIDAVRQAEQQLQTVVALCDIK